jgi:hypothetical protein
MNTCIKHLDQYFIWVRHHYLMFFVRSRMTPQKNQFMNFLTGYCMNFLTGLMTSYFWDVILTPLLWRHIFVTSFWRRHYDVIFLWRHFDAVIMTSYFCDVILTPLFWCHVFVTSFPHRSYNDDGEPCKSTENDATEKCIMRSWICSFHLPCAEVFCLLLETSCCY